MRADQFGVNLDKRGLSGIQLTHQYKNILAWDFLKDL